jgi:hypothetical protein
MRMANHTASRRADSHLSQRSWRLVLDVSAALGGVLAATAQGRLTPEEAATIAGVLETKRRVLETVEIEARVAALEQAWPGSRR